MSERGEIERTLRRALHRLAPLGGERRLHVNAAADALTGLLAELVDGATRPDSEDEIERLCALFRERLTAEMAERAAASGARKH